MKPDLVASDLRGANLHIADLRWAILSESNLSSANLSEADLRGANLHIADLRRAILSESDLGSAILSEADLSWANLSRANFHGGDLSGANLHGAKLDGADLRRANLHGAKLDMADFSGADLSEADLSKADLSGAKFSATILADVDLSQVKGLEEVRHIGPSEISISTIYKSKGKIQEVFLRGCGVPESMITFMHSLVGTAIEFYSCFISYSSKDEDFAKTVRADLQSKGVRVWFAPEDLKIGDKFGSRIDEAIRVCDKLLLVLSENSINSAWAEKEAETAFEKEQKQNRTVLFPVRLDDAVLKTDQAWAADIRRTRHIGDMGAWKDRDRYQAAFERLLRDLREGESK